MTRSPPHDPAGLVGAEALEHGLKRRLAELDALLESIEFAQVASPRISPS
jgi:hypothetical protein